MGVIKNNLLWILAFLAWSFGPIAGALAEDASQTAVQLQTKYEADLDQLAKSCEAKGLKEEARKTRQAIAPRDPLKFFLPVLPEAVGPPSLPEGASQEVVEWDAQLWKLRREQAASLYDLARKTEKAGHARAAFEMILAAIQADPNNEPVRRLLGYQKFHDQWRTPFEMRKQRLGQVWSDKFGWLLKTHLPRYEKGERFSDGRWISAEDDAKKHSDIRSGWDIDTEHYMIRTNQSIEAAVEMGVKLERLERLWRQLFIRYYASESDVAALFEGRYKLGFNQRRHDVVLFNDREEYLHALQEFVPNMGISIGMYYERTRRAYFFAGKESDDRTLYHEATHQLFHESRPVAPDVGYRANFWIVEGIAMFMESLRQEDGYYVFGGFEDQRLQAARTRLLDDHFYVPLKELTALGMEKLQAQPKIATLYSQAAGLTNFLIFYDGGRYRDALLAYLLAVYTGRDTPDTLAKLTGESYETLDKQYREFLEKGERK
jgi:hypothetical protein